MGTTSSPEVFVSKLRKTATALGDVPRESCRAAALIVKTSTLEQIGAIAPTFRLSGVGAKGARVGVRYVDGVSAAGVASTIVFATGPVPLIERDTKAHDIAPRSQSRKTAKGRARGRARALGSLARGFGPVAHVHVPGTHGRHPFEKGVDAARPLTGAAMRTATHQALARSLGVL